MTTLLEREKLDLEIVTCPLCGNHQFQTEFVKNGFQVQKCSACHLELLNPQPSDGQLDEIYSSNYFLGDKSEKSLAQVAEMKRATAQLYLKSLLNYGAPQGGRLLEVGCGSGDFLREAQLMGFEVTGVEYPPYAVADARAKVEAGGGLVYCGEVADLDLPQGYYDVCVLSDVVEHVRRPDQFIQLLHRLLKPGATLLLVTPTLSSWSARLLGQHWMEYKTEHLYYFDNNTVQTLLFQNGFRQMLVQPNFKMLTLRYIFDHFARYPVPVITPTTNIVRRLLPRPLLDRRLKFAASGVRITAQAQPVRARPLLSVIVPVYNEKATFSQMFEQLINKEMEEVDIEIVVVESNSKDGTRQEVLKYQDHPRVRLMLQDRPRGKGNAVRAGLKEATGDFILIQDADLEYDMNDYAMLLKPLIEGRTAFVLGSRHGLGGVWKMRQFTDQPGTSFTMNLGHIVFTSLVNLFYFQRLKDPFTMYKVIRRDCLAGLEFECNRFDFDFELVIKLLRKGYKPLEIPATYNSRSFKEGKKVSMWRDPLTWIRALTRFRVQPLRLEENIARANRQQREA